MRYDALIVGAGLYGAAVARTLLDAGRRVLVVEQRPVIGGNCADAVRDGQLVNLYGGHIFHTSNEGIWKFVQRFGAWRPVTHLKLAQHGARVFSFPINLLTLHQLWGVTTEAEARDELEARRYDWVDPSRSMEGYCLHHLGPEIYETFILGYTTKQWGRSPAALPASIVKRIPVRFDWNARMFDDTYEAVPVEGYSALIAAMLDGADVYCAVDYLADRARWDAYAPVTVYSGPLDALYGYSAGRLAYRSLRFEYGTGATLGAETINYTDAETPYTRRVDFAQIRRERHPAHVVMTEYPADEGDPMYPVRDAENTARHARYEAMAAAEGRLVVGGRLGRYAYTDMAPTIAMGIKAGRGLL
jgi:UDP-galactopyranose mutase